MRRIELLSPAGGMEALHAAIQNGADAVYLGEKSFSARQNAKNFDTQELKEAVKYSHERGSKVYLALNTLITNDEIDSFENSVVLANECGVDALIIQDFGGAEIARRVCPSLERHASTQMSAHNEKDVIKLLEAGFSRVVLARELKEKEISDIYRNTKASLEVFVHGALCICASGQCLMSSFIGGRSGNRGNCAQPCRQLYSADGKKGYFLSPRDLCLIDEIESLSAAGVDSLKIEGRMKSAEYVAAVTAMYRKYIDNPKRATREDIKELEKIFVRGDGFTKAYYKGFNTPEIMNYNMSNDAINSKSDKEALKRAAQSYRDGVENKKIPVNGYFTVRENEQSMLVLSDGENTSVKQGAIPQKAHSRPLDENEARERIGKMGQTPFVLDYFEADIDDAVTISAKDINALRRECTDELMELRSEITPKPTYKFDYEYTRRERKPFMVSASVLTKEQFEGAEGADLIYMPLSLFEKLDEKSEKYVVQLPKVTYDINGYIERLKKAGAKKVACSTVGAIKAVLDADMECVGDYGLNIFNPISANEYKKMGIGHITLSPELGAAQIRTVTDNTDAVCEVLAYGRQMMMTTRACIIKGIRGKCDCDRGLILRDKTGAGFWVYADKNEHINTIYNTSVTFMADKPSVLKSLGADYIRLVFTNENKREACEIISMYKGETEAKLPKSFTRGYFSNTGKNKQKG